MKRKLLHWKLRAVVLIVCATLIFTACNDDEKPKTVPVVTTSALTDITPISAKGGGEITSDGNGTITASGLVYSSTNATPTIADSKTEGTVTGGTFTSDLEGLTSGTTYHVRAYATNSVGTGYGEVVDFATGNATPIATNVSVTGTAQVAEELTAAYTYSDSDNDVEGTSTFQWYRANDAAGTSEAAIEGATGLTYTLVVEDEFKYIRFGVTPIAGAGNMNGTEVKSAFAGPVAEEPTTVTFTYNGAEVTYGIIISSVTGRRWLDRNLGAPNAPTAYDDFANYGDAFQWGRAADGHQLVNRGGNSNSLTTAVNGSTTTLSSIDIPSDALFIINANAPYDWRNPGNSNLWQGVNGINNPCPTGWRIPTISEWELENVAELASGFSQLKLTLGGRHSGTSGTFALVSSDGIYWSSTAIDTGWSWAMYYATDEAYPTGSPRSNGSFCRCIKE